jgi:hypothetical protein
MKRTAEGRYDSSFRLHVENRQDSPDVPGFLTDN